MRRSKSEETLCRLLITMAEETFDMRMSRVNLEKQIMNLMSEYVEEENFSYNCGCVTSQSVISVDDEEILGMHSKKSFPKAVRVEMDER